MFWISKNPYTYKKEGFNVNHKKVYRIYKELNLKVLKRTRKRALGSRICLSPLKRPNERWSLDFVSDALSNGRRIRVLTIIDEFSRECLKMIVDTFLSGRRVVRELSEIIKQRGPPRTILSDNGT